MPGDEESMSDEAIWETLPVSIELVFFFIKKPTVSSHVVLVAYLLGEI